MNLEIYNNIDYSSSNLELEEAILDILMQCTDASDEDISIFSGLIDKIYDFQWNKWQTLSPTGIDVIKKFIFRNWSTSNYARFKLCCDLILFNYLYTELNLLSDALNSDAADVRSLAVLTIHGMTSYTVRTESIFNRINTIISLSSEKINGQYINDLLKLRNSVPLNQGDLADFTPLPEIFDDMPNFLSAYWQSEQNRWWLHELKMDYLSLVHEKLM